MYNSYNYSNNSGKAPWTFAQQKRDVKASLSKAIGPGQIWEPVQIAWFRAWKQYVFFDGEGEDTR